MLKPKKIFEKKEAYIYMRDRSLLKQYRKAKQYLIEGGILQVRFKERQPKGSGIWYFRVNRQYRALGVFDEDGNLIVFAVDDHQ